MQDLESDLGDGLVLLKLLETLSPDSRMPGRYVCCMYVANACDRREGPFISRCAAGCKLARAHALASVLPPHLYGTEGAPKTQLIHEHLLPSFYQAPAQ